MDKCHQIPGLPDELKCPDAAVEDVAGGLVEELGITSPACLPRRLAAPGRQEELGQGGAIGLRGEVSCKVNGRHPAIKGVQYYELLPRDTERAEDRVPLALEVLNGQPVPESAKLRCSRDRRCCRHLHRVGLSSSRASQVEDVRWKDSRRDNSETWDGDRSVDQALLISRPRFAVFRDID